MADERTEKQKVQGIIAKLEEELKELFEREKYKTYLSTMSKKFLRGDVLKALENFGIVVFLLFLPKEIRWENMHKRAKSPGENMQVYIKSRGENMHCELTLLIFCENMRTFLL